MQLTHLTNKTIYIENRGLYFFFIFCQKTALDGRRVKNSYAPHPGRLERQVQRGGSLAKTH
jgi:hypothetical protein